MHNFFRIFYSIVNFLIADSVEYSADVILTSN